MLRRFESGNLRRAVQVYEYEYDLILKPDVNTRGALRRISTPEGPRLRACLTLCWVCGALCAPCAFVFVFVFCAGHTQWFYFSVRNVRPGVSYKFNIINLMKGESLYNAGARPPPRHTCGGALRHVLPLFAGMQPVMYSTRAAEERGVGWVRAGTNVAYYQVRGVGEQDHRVRA